MTLRRRFIGLIIYGLIMLLFVPVLQPVVPADVANGGSREGARAQVDDPALYWPFDSMVNGTLRPEFIFMANYSETGGLTYTIELAEEPGFSEVAKVYASNLDGGFRSLDFPTDTQPFRPNYRMAFVPFNPLQDGKTYWWRVMAEEASTQGTASQWSQVRSFTLDSASAYHQWRQDTPEQLLTGTYSNMEVKGGGIGLSTTDTVIFSETFPSMTINVSNWPQSSGPVTIDNIASREPSEPYSLRLNGHSTRGDMVVSKEMDLSEFENGNLTFHWEAGGGGNSPDPGEWLKVEIYTISGWTEAFFRDGNGSNMQDFVREVVPLPTGAFHQNFRIRITNNAFGAGDDWFVDDVDVRCNSFKAGSVVSGPVRYEDGPLRRTAWSTASFEASGNVTVSVEAFINGSWVATGLEAGDGLTGVHVIDLGVLEDEPLIRLQAHMEDPGSGSFLDWWSVEWARPEAPFVRVISPTPGEVLGVNVTYVIKWEAKAEAFPLAANPISIFFSSNGTGSNFVPIVQGIANSGEYSWVVPKNVSQKCFIRIDAIDDLSTPTVGSDTIDDAFSIVVKPPKVTLLTPNGDDVLATGERVLIKWIAEPGSYKLPTRPISIYLSPTGSVGNYEVLFEDIANTGNITWDVPNLNSQTCFIKVTVRDNQVVPATASDISDAQFTIRPDTTRPYVVVSQPKDGTKDFPPFKTVMIVFSEDMDRSAAQAAFTIEPKVKGDFVWSDRTLIFAPRQGLQESTEYKITIDRSAADENGNELEADYKATFRTGRSPETALERISFVVLALFAIGLGLGIAGGGWYLKQAMDAVEASRPPTVIDEIFLMTDSGKLIKHFTRRLKPDVDQDILSGMLVAVQGFVKDTFKGEEGQLEELTFGEFKILIVRGRYAMIAAVVKGPDPEGLKDQLLNCITDLERKEKKVLKVWDGDNLKVQCLDPYLKGLIAGKYKKD